VDLRADGGAVLRRSSSSARAAIDRTFVALADPARRRVVELLRSEPKRAGDIAAGLGMSAPATSRHLRLLHRSGLVEATSVEEDARLRVFRLRPEPFVELQSWLAEVEKFWADQLDAFRAYTEHTRAARHRTEKGRRRG
jgi:DNA-binding transcriptional ArsR family regulator